jgi:protein phosphatase
MSLNLVAHGVTHAGRVRKNNEDALSFDANLGLFLVADGMGGHNAGEVASALAVEAIQGFLVRSKPGDDFTWPYGIDPTLSFLGNRLSTAIKLANRRVFKAGESHDSYTGLGTTVVAMAVEDDQCAFSGVGDSRIYLWAEGRLEQLTRDDSWVATVLAREPSMDEAAIASHPMRHVLTNVIGAREPIDMDIHERALRGGERFLLCSDGLHGVLDDAQLERVLASGGTPTAMADDLIRQALDRNAPDNVTALIVACDRTA